jgi:hypothetical protein
VRGILGVLGSSLSNYRRRDRPPFPDEETARAVAHNHIAEGIENEPVTPPVCTNPACPGYQTAHGPLPRHTWEDAE